jgi:hypothetical protein
MKKGDAEFTTIQIRTSGPSIKIFPFPSLRPSEFNPSRQQGASLADLESPYGLRPAWFERFLVVGCFYLERDVMDFFNSYMLETCNVAVAGLWYETLLVSWTRKPLVI